MGIRVTDNFNRANINPIAGVWSTPTGGGGGGQIVANQLLGGTAPGDNFIFYNADTPPNDHYCKIKFISTENAGGDADDGGPCVRFTSGGNGYLFNVQSNNPLNNTTWDIFSVSAGVGTSLLTGTTGSALVSGDIVECRAVGTTISGWINGVQIASVVNGTFPTGGGYGVHMFEGGAVNGKWDDFEGGDFVTAGPGSNIVIRGGRGVDLGPSGRRMMPQQFPVAPPPDTTQSPAAPFTRGPGSGPPRRRRIPQQFPQVPVTAVTVALTGASATFLAGTLGVTHTQALTGQAATFSAGTVKAALSKALTGSAGTFSRGTVGVTHAQALTGQRGTFSSGIVSSALSVPLSGSRATFGAGTVTPVTGLFVALTGISATFNSGLLTATAESSQIRPVVGGSGKSKYNEIIELEGKRWSIPKDKVAEFLARFAPKTETVEIQTVRSEDIFLKPVTFTTPTGKVVKTTADVLKDDIGVILVMAALADEDFYEN